MAAFLDRHPSFAEGLRSPSRQAWLAGGPTRGWRPIYRRTFYVLIVVALLAVTFKIHSLQLSSVELAQQLDREKSELNVRSDELVLRGRHLRNAVAGNMLLIVLNALFAVRGVQIWSLLRRVGFEGWIHTIARQLPWTRRVAKLWNWATLPVRAPFHWPGRWASGRRAAAMEREAAEKAAEALARLPWRLAARKTWGAAGFLDRKTGCIASSVRSIMWSGVARMSR